MSSVRVLLCDDSAVIRRLIKMALLADPQIVVVGEAKHGQEAIEMVASQSPDVIVMDVEMPVMDGIDATRRIRQRSPSLPIIMFSSLTSRGAEATLDALGVGANDFATKPSSSGHIDGAMAHVRRELIPRIYQWTGKPQRDLSRKSSTVAVPRASTSAFSSGHCDVGVIAIGVSTGGPQALAKLVGELAPELPVPVLIVQHMPPVFTGMLAERLSKTSGHVVREAENDQELRAGDILLAPGDWHMTVARRGTGRRVRLDQGEPENSCRPAVDPLFRSCAEVFGSRSFGVILTGMGKDGEYGSRALKRVGAKVIVQDEASSVIWGMPGNVFRSGLADRALPLDQIAHEINRTVRPVAETL